MRKQAEETRRIGVAAATTAAAAVVIIVVRNFALHVSVSVTFFGASVHMFCVNILFGARVQAHARIILSLSRSLPTTPIRAFNFQLKYYDRNVIVIPFFLILSPLLLFLFGYCNAAAIPMHQAMLLFA